MCRPLNASCFSVSSTSQTPPQIRPHLARPLSDQFQAVFFLEEEKVTRTKQNLSHTGGTLPTKTSS